VHLLCQDLEAGSLEWVDRVGRWSDGGLAIEPAGSGGGAGTITAYTPDIGGLLPVYVADPYEGFRVKTFSELTEPELANYLETNVEAVSEVVEVAGGIDAALSNHLVMGPAILARAGLRFAAAIHGSALEYTVKPDPDRFLSYAREGTDAASGVLVGSRHTAESLWAAIGDPSLPAKTRLGPPGVDTQLFFPLPRDEARGRLRELAGQVEEVTGQAGEGGLGAGSTWDRDTEQAAGAIQWFAEAEGPRVVMVGKLIVSKGVDLLLAAWPLVYAANPGARLLIVGFGEYDAGLRRLWDSLSTGEMAGAGEIAARGRGLEGGKERPLRILGGFLESPPAEYSRAAEAAAASVAFAGRLEHDEVGRLVPAADALVFPSTFPEAFGMVAAEAAAAGVLPVSAGHSGALEVSRALAASLPAEVAELVSFPVDEGAVLGIAERLNAWLSLDPVVRERARSALAETSGRLWSWEGVARGVLAASAGRLDELPRVPAD
jgi:glycosyltransferase involved in cell wall biosynthesis